MGAGENSSCGLESITLCPLNFETLGLKLGKAASGRVTLASPETVAVLRATQPRPAEPRTTTTSSLLLVRCPVET